MFFGGIFDIALLNKQLINLKEKSTDPDFWNDKKKASAILRNISRIEKEINLWSDIEQKYNDVEVLFEFYEEGDITLDDLIHEVEKCRSSIFEILKSRLPR